MSIKAHVMLCIKKRWSKKRDFYVVHVSVAACKKAHSRKNYSLSYSQIIALKKIFWGFPTNRYDSKQQPQNTSQVCFLGQQEQTFCLETDEEIRNGDDEPQASWGFFSLSFINVPDICCCPSLKWLNKNIKIDACINQKSFGNQWCKEGNMLPQRVG